MAQAVYSEKRSTLWLAKAPLLSHLDIELTERCNNACLHCCINLPADDPAAKHHELTTDQWKEILRQTAELGALSVRFTGGEPLLRDDFSELYLFARRLGMKVKLFTNARSITAEIADLFVRVPPLEKIDVSVYGMRAESYDAAAGCPGAFVEFRAGIQLLLERRIPFTVKGALLPSNKAEVGTFISWAGRLPGMEHPPSMAMFFNQRIRRDSPARSRTIDKVRIPPEEGLAILARQGGAYRAEMRGLCLRCTSLRVDRLFDCGAGKSGCVDAYGKYQPCLLLRAPAFAYDIQSGSLRDALTNFFPQRMEARAANPDYLQRCARCFLHGICEQCPARSWMEHGTLDAPVEYFCQVAHAQARYLGLLKKGESAWEVQDWQSRIGRITKGE